ncbi:hypothetical protein THAOC_32023 [Thalassiosira oceanica]|uniref:Uncharacterized protein n=1 Tax=Thalassiosira oceanica TaxID=159749 RepID=K0RR20_THAOC|nr:hypothetical protein THAOC_32023 [Thalassiosira oceanica]|eukprot:EJK49127.1 hypothetical protein THAOC_32023 [Thalassiosira oceanica]
MIINNQNLFTINPARRLQEKTPPSGPPLQTPVPQALPIPEFDIAREALCGARFDVYATTPNWRDQPCQQNAAPPILHQTLRQHGPDLSQLRLLFSQEPCTLSLSPFKDRPQADLVQPSHLHAATTTRPPRCYHHHCPHQLETPQVTSNDTSLAGHSYTAPTRPPASTSCRSLDST